MRPRPPATPKPEPRPVGRPTASDAFSATVAVKVTTAIEAQLVAVAKRHHTSVSTVLRLAIMQLLSRHGASSPDELL